MKLTASVRIVGVACALGLLSCSNDSDGDEVKCEGGKMGILAHLPGNTVNEAFPAKSHTFTNGGYLYVGFDGGFIRTEWEDMQSNGVVFPVTGGKLQVPGDAPRVVTGGTMTIVGRFGYEGKVTVDGGDAQFCMR
jgi:hypothetical protein